MPSVKAVDAGPIVTREQAEKTKSIAASHPNDRDTIPHERSTLDGCNSRYEPHRAWALTSPSIFCGLLSGRTWASSMSRFQYLSTLPHIGKKNMRKARAKNHKLLTCSRTSLRRLAPPEIERTAKRKGLYNPQSKRHRLGRAGPLVVCVTTPIQTVVKLP